MARASDIITAVVVQCMCVCSPLRGKFKGTTTAAIFTRAAACIHSYTQEQHSISLVMFYMSPRKSCKISPRRHFSTHMKFPLVKVYPRSQALVRGSGKRAWYTLFAHAPSSLGNLHTTPLHKLQSISVYLLKGRTAWLLLPVGHIWAICKSQVSSVYC